ncbi:hypothetical protein AVEN_254585-1 [Araneus ventricosus]|uniref:Uncharacterized protein n=1 Tax=Araneus ventricosus TaxID=182803 RepID=A0A4Y2GF24_ARAVE|nr:hypothetical protein AVEN_254585-1 [Araneus ventricosus]
MFLLLVWCGSFEMGAISGSLQTKSSSVGVRRLPAGAVWKLEMGAISGFVNTMRHELKLHRPILWIICLLHFNELPLRHLFERKSSGLTSYTRDIGRNLKGYEKLPRVSFNSIECELPGIDPTT